MAMSLRIATFLVVSATAITFAVVGSAEPVPATASAVGISLNSVSLTLPSSDREYPNGIHADAINNNCLACHSAGMVLTQPRLSRAEWQGEVTKMIQVYKAPVEPADAALIVDYLAQLRPGP